MGLAPPLGMVRTSTLLGVAVLALIAAPAAPARADIALEPCTSLGSAPACTAGDVGKTCPSNGGTCAAINCDGDAGATVAYLCSYTDKVGGGGCSCGAAGRQPTLLGFALTLMFGGAALLFANARRRRSRARAGQAAARARASG